MPSQNPWKFEAKQRNYKPIKRVYVCRATYTFEGLLLKCQGKGKHKGVHMHALARPGAVVCVTWHQMVTTNRVPTKRPKSVGKMVEQLELENYADSEPDTVSRFIPLVL